MAEPGLEVHPIGLVHSPISDARAMPAEGVEAELELFAAFRPGLISSEANSHLIVLGWFDRASRDVTQVGTPDARRGVFGLRSAARPNPIGLAVCRHLGLTDRGLRVADLDFLDGTPIVDVKRYSPSWDCVFAARSSRDARPAELSDEQLDEAIREAVAFHGERCPTLISGCRLVLATAAAWGMARKARELAVRVSDDACLADTLQALTAATFGSGRLSWSRGAFSTLMAPGQVFRFVRRTWDTPNLEFVRSAPLEELFAFLDPRPWQIRQVR